METLDLLRKYFGHDSFRSGQAELIDHILAGQDVLGIMPTGAGKSVCYQIPALMMDGITIVVSPLISLMTDQVQALLDAGIAAGCIHSGLSAWQYFDVFRQAESGAIKILYVAPERLDTEAFLGFAARTKIAMVTVDEAHCVSQWGQDFRPSYLHIVDFIEQLPYRPVISAFTATATREVRTDIAKILRLQEPFTLATGFDRKNLYFGVVHALDKYDRLTALLANFQNKFGIVYCLSRKNVEEVCERLNADGFSATRYHAGLSPEERAANQDDFLYDRKSIMVATNAFGMGIDKSNVGFVIHYNMPKNIESYYQEAGRAGRDGEPADCILLYHGQDVRLNQFLIERGRDENEDLTPEQAKIVYRKDMERLKHMTYYATTTECLRGFMLKYFGEQPPAACGHCSVCDAQFETRDITTDAQKILSCVYRVHQRGRDYGKTMISDILKGRKTEKLLQNHLDKLSTYGLMADVSLELIRREIDWLIQNQYLTQTKDEYPVLRLSAQSAAVLKGQEKLAMKVPKAPDKAERPKPKATPVRLSDIDTDLFSALRKVRSGLAAKENVPAYRVMTDASLHDMCRKLPVTAAAFTEISGVGAKKAERYSEPFCEAIAAYLREKQA